MGFIFRLILFIIIFSWVLRALRRLVFRRFYNKHFNQRGESSFNSSQQQENKPETQEDRILDYQRKRFESTDVEDADFEEIK